MENSRKRIRDVRRHSGDAEPLGYGFRRRNSGDEDGAPGGSIYTNEPNKKQVMEANQKERQHDDFRVSKPSSLVGFECSEGPRLEQFEVGDVVWVKSKRRKDRPVWPAKDRLCYKLYKFNQYCGISMKVRTPTFKIGWLQCQKCNVWVHYNCDNISSEQLENLNEYSCPQCTPKQPALGISLKEKNKKSFSVPEHLTVICNGKEANYVTNSHLILCECNECGKGKSMSLSRWEKHVGSKMKKWKQSVRLSGSNQHLIDWLNKACEAGVRGLGFFTQEGRTPFSNRERELRGWLLEPYEPIQETWIQERCAICRQAEDWQDNKFIICNGCNIGVHENCYGASESGEDWLCTACQNLKTDTTPQRCCLCPVMGGALKPTTTSGFWVHVTCACFTNEVTFLNDKTMEPVDGILKINPDSFRKSCIVCNKMQGSCVKCMECESFYHPTCALIEGYHMELSYWNNKGKDVCTYISYCASHRVPDPNVGVRIPDRNSILMGIQKEAAAVTHSEGSSDESSSSNDGNNLEEVGLCKIEEPYASRTSVHNRLKAKSGISSIIHQPVGYSHHSREAINKRLKTEPEADPPQFSSYRDRLSYCQKNEKNRFRFGKSGVHGYGLFTIEPIRRWEMVIEYRGEVIRNNVANLREKRYQSEGRQSTYLFAIDKETVIDSTKKGNAARMINHSCAPNCFSRILPVGVERRIALFAKKDIEAGEEITCDYMLTKEGMKERCFCGAATCRKVM